MLPAAYLDGIRLFNEGRFWDAHEALEEVWRPLPTSAPERRFYQGLILMAAACLHLERAKTAPERSTRPALRCYRSGLEKLEGYPDVYLGLDLEALRRAARGAFEPLAGGADPAAIPRAPRLVFGRGGA